MGFWDWFKPRKHERHQATIYSTNPYYVDPFASPVYFIDDPTPMPSNDRGQGWFDGGSSGGAGGGSSWDSSASYGGDSGGSCGGDGGGCGGGD